MKVYNVKVEAKMQFHFPIVARNSAEAENIVHDLCGVNGAETDDEMSLFLGILTDFAMERLSRDGEVTCSNLDLRADIYPEKDFAEEKLNEIGLFRMHPVEQSRMEEPEKVNALLETMGANGILMEIPETSCCILFDERCMLHLENGLSVIEKKVYRDRTKRTEYPKKETFRDSICAAIDKALAEKPKDFEELLKLLEQAGYECKRGKNIAVRGKGQKRFICFCSLGDGYTQEEIMAVISGNAQHKTKSKKKPLQDNQKLNLILDIQEKMAQNGESRNRVKRVNLSKFTLLANLLLLLFQHIKNSGDYIFRCFQQSFVIMSRVL